MFLVDVFFKESYHKIVFLNLFSTNFVNIAMSIKNCLYLYKFCEYNINKISSLRSIEVANCNVDTNFELNQTLFLWLKFCLTLFWYLDGYREGNCIDSSNNINIFMTNIYMGLIANPIFF